MNKISEVFRITWLVLLLALTLFFIMPTPVSADTAAPNTTAINETKGWTNVLELGDLFIVARYTVAYGANPGADISETFLFRLMDASNTVELASTVAYPYLNGGYGTGVVGWYFPASVAPAYNGNYWIKIQGKVTAFTNPPVTNYQISSISYFNSTTQSAVQTDIGNTIIRMAITIGNSWSPAVTLTQSIDTGDQILTQAGSDYFNDSLPGIHAMAPFIFLIGVGNPTAYASDSWNTTQSQTYEDRLKGTDFGNAIQGVADLFSVNYTLAACIPIMIVCLALIIIGASAGNVVSGFMNSACLITAGAWVGLFPSMPMTLIAFGAAGFIIFHLAWKTST